MNVEFSQIPAKLNYPRHLKGKLSSLHSDVITYVSETYDGSHTSRTRAIRLLNTLTRYVVDGDMFPSNWNSSKPFDHLILEDEFSLKESLGNLYINPKEVNFDIPVVVERDVLTSTTSESAPEPITPKKKRTQKQKVNLVQETDKRDLYIQPPVVPQFDVTKPWMRASIDGTIYCIYQSIPVIPTKQNEISATTNVQLMSESQLLNLYPNNFIRTRAPALYEATSDLPYDSQLGIILPVEGFTSEELRNNIIQYPHLFKLSKLKDEEVISFYSTIEIQGQLYRISEVWKDLPDTSKIPYTADFVKEYVVRRYLLERDCRGVKHQYPMNGELDPYLTLFTTPSDYIKWGHTDIINIAKKCVESRVSYKRSRNPVMRRVQNV